MFQCTHVVEQKERQKECCGFACRTGNGHGECAKVLGDGGGTGGTEEAHATKEDHDNEFTANRPSAIF